MTLKPISRKFWSARSTRILLSISLLLAVIPALAWGAEDPIMPMLSMQLGGQGAPEKVATSLEIMALLTVLSLAPSIILSITSFTRIIIVFHFLRQALGIQQIPPNQVLAGLAIFMTVVIMMPTGSRINTDALQPYLNEDIGYKEALQKAESPVRSFLFKHTREKDISVFFAISGLERPQNKDDVPTIVLIPAYMISEMKTGFQIGFLIYIPFLIIDMVVASILLSMGMMMLPPTTIALPFKILLFVMVDGWNLIIGSLVNSFS